MTTAAVTPAHAQVGDSVTVHFDTDLGTPARRAAGMLYGLTQNGANPPGDFLTRTGMRHMRAGGSQIGNPGGWATSVASYQQRWNSTLAQYQRFTGLTGGSFVLIVNDLWGADATWSNPYPGDNNNWSSYDAFLNRLIADVRASGMNPQWDLWNEPDITPFWDRTQAQYQAMWQRGYRRVRQTSPHAVIVGPSTSASPPGGSAWWTGYLNFVAANSVVPNIVSWHSLSPGAVTEVDPRVARQTVDGWLSSRGISRPYQINEYAWGTQQNPGNSAWYICRLEREDIDGLRANWGSGGLHDNMAAMLTGSGTTYQTLGDWILYREYAAMTGTRVSVTPGGSLDAFATKDSGVQQARILLGNAGPAGTTQVNLTGLGGASYLVVNGQIRVTVRRVPYNNGGVVTAPAAVSDITVPVTNNAASFEFAWGNPNDAYVVTLGTA